jgi:hypothetical protein
MWLARKINRLLRGIARITSIHAAKRADRCELAAQVFSREAARHKSAAIVCKSSAILDILASLGFEVDDRAKWWTTARKVALANRLLKEKFGDKDVSLATKESNADLLWLDGTDASKSANLLSTIIFSGGLREDPFVGFWRDVVIKRGDSVIRGHAPAGKRVSEWLNANT